MIVCSGPVFWKKWRAATDGEKIRMLHWLPITKIHAQLYYPKLDNESAMNVVATMLNSYFEDLAESLE